MMKHSLWWAVLSVPLLLSGADRASAVEYGELIEKNGKWQFKETEDPVFKLLRDAGWISNEQYFQVSERKGKNWIEPADAVLA
jgi:hypothetical protein